MDELRNSFSQILQTRNGGPFLFVGSGFSRRYLGLEDWRGLLSRFCVSDKPFEYYLARANGDFPELATLLAEDFNEYWFKAEEYKHSVEVNKPKIRDVTSALRIEICKYLSTLGQAKAKADYPEEVELLAGLNVDGIITTNWDMFLEQVFPDYKTYVGQRELLFSNPQQIGEIYKIHGCSTAPNSLILTAEDYKAFNDNNAYLASKLITIFVEHPVIFIGYSLSDKNITNILRAISLCIGKENIEKLRKNLIFIQRLEEKDKPGVSDTYITIDGVQIPLILIKTDDLRPIYQALAEIKRKIPARVLRYCKEQLYELVKSTEPEKKLCVVDIDEIDRKEDIEFLVGVGVASTESSTPSEIGYVQIETNDLIQDILYDDKKYDAQQVIDNVIRKAGRNTKNVPVFKYLNAIGVNSAEDYSKSGLNLDKWVVRDIKDFRVKMYSKPFFRYRHLTMADVIEECTSENVAAYIPFFPVEKIDLTLLKNFLIQNEQKFDSNVSNYASNFRKLAVLYDKLKWGW